MVYGSEFGFDYFGLLGMGQTQRLRWTLGLVDCGRGLWVLCAHVEAGMADYKNANALVRRRVGLDWIGSMVTSPRRVILAANSCLVAYLYWLTHAFAGLAGCGSG